MPKVRLTNTVVEKATCPPGKDRREWWDTVSTGLVLRVTDSGAKSWYAIYRSPVTNKQTKLRLGDVKETLASNGLTLAQARSENVKIQGDIDAGRDPRLERKRAQAEERRQLEAEWHERSRATFRDLVDDCRDRCPAAHTPRARPVARLERETQRQPFAQRRVAPCRQPTPAQQRSRSVPSALKREPQTKPLRYPARSVGRDVLHR